MIRRLAAAAVLVGISCSAAMAEPVKIAYSRYTGWEPLGYMQESGILNKWNKKLGTDVSIYFVGDYVDSVTLYGSGEFAGVSVTNMDVLAIAGGGDGGGGGESIHQEASYPGNIGMMELAKFFQMAAPDEKDQFKKLLELGKKGLAWKLVQDIVGVKLQGDEFKTDENFADGKRPQDKGDSKRHGINTKPSVSSLRKTAKQGGRKGQLAHWLANMKAGRAKKK